MKNFIAIIAVLFIVTVFPYQLSAARQSHGITGRVVDNDKNPLEFATVVLLNGAEQQIAACMSDENGTFALSASDGKYTIRITFFGCKEYSQDIVLNGELNIGEVAMQSDSKMLGEFTVVGNRINREADRFIVNVDGDPSAIGKDSYEMLKTAPGVWISSQNGITINGRSGTQVMINDRLLRMSDDQLEAYLRTIKAEDILKIEVIPTSGADFDADSSAGIIKITLKKRRENGIDGSVGISGHYGDYGSHNYSPSGNINYQANKLNLYTALGYSHNNSRHGTTDRTEYTSAAMNGSEVNSGSVIKGDSDSFNGRVGGGYDFNEKHSVGLEANVNIYNSDSDTNARSMMNFGAASAMGIDSMLTRSTFDSDTKTNYYAGTANYLYKVDNMGSMLKVIADYTRNDSKNTTRSNNAFDYYTGGATAAGIDSLNRRGSKTSNDMFSFSTDYTKVFPSRMTLKVGGKYSLNDMHSDVSATYQLSGTPTWTDIPSESLTTNYKENIGAVYATLSGRLGTISYTIGLRGEYTNIDPRFESGTESSTLQKRDYFDIFPNANIMLPLNKQRSNSLILSYSRSIQRPGFWALNPIRNDLDNYSYTVGNPDLKPSYMNNLSLTGVYKYRYTLTLGAYFSKDGVQQVVSYDETDPNILRYRYENTAKSATYFAALSIPLNITKWWSLNANVFGMHRTERLEAGSELQKGWTVQGYAAMNFSLPADFEIEVSYWAMSKIKYSNMVIRPMNGLNAGIKKRFANNRFTASLSFNNIISPNQRVISSGTGFRKSAFVSASPFNVSASFRYNFKSGVKVRARQIERATDQGRMGGGNSGATGIDVGK